jgi:CRP-like cAMP-binding protein
MNDLQSNLEHLRLLQNMPIFGGVETAVLEFLLQSSRFVNCAQGEFFFREGDLANSMFVLERGYVAIYRRWQGKSYKLRELGSGDCFGEMALMDCKPRSASVKALQNSGAVEINTAQLSQLYDRNPEQFTLIQMNMGREVCRRLRDADKRLFVTEVTRCNAEHT